MSNEQVVNLLTILKNLKNLIYQSNLSDEYLDDISSKKITIHSKLERNIIYSNLRLICSLKEEILNNILEYMSDEVIANLNKYYESISLGDKERASKYLDDLKCKIGIDGLSVNFYCQYEKHYFHYDGIEFEYDSTAIIKFSDDMVKEKSFYEEDIKNIIGRIITNNSIERSIKKRLNSFQEKMVKAYKSIVSSIEEYQIKIENIEENAKENIFSSSQSNDNHYSADSSNNFDYSFSQIVCANSNNEEIFNELKKLLISEDISSDEKKVYNDCLYLLT